MQRTGEKDGRNEGRKREGKNDGAKWGEGEERRKIERIGRKEE